MTTQTLNRSALEVHGFKTITAFQDADNETIPLNQLQAIKDIAPRARDEFMATGQPVAVHQFLCSTSPYPTTYAFHASYEGLHPFIFFNNRATLVQFKNNGQLKNFLFNPFFPELSVQAPFYQSLQRRMPGFIPESMFVKRETSIINQIRAVGIEPEDIDYISYDHLHVQDMRDLMGTVDGQGQPARKALFPNATFIFPKREWEATINLHPVVSQWYVKNGLQNVQTDNLLLYEGDLQIGPGVALMASPGHTPGNHSLYLNTSSGTMTISENAVGPDAFNPENSRINSVKRAAADRGWEVVLNANTLDEIFNQYNSVVKEKLLSGPNPNHPEFCNHHSSSEFTSWPFNPGLAPTMEWGPVEHGQIAR